ncbi:hypothetical protein JK635_16075 [Neobacillus sp. YIM B02564]|uniref:Uncharacterized protein n=1 Tax=Neobacillus paridis TaxID=2803862 RepID=A0ABS1TQX7_9BACI|nr:hypothetical protein [Neobacillus paridis]MBL4953706.1 hypothetical protein [Neobacillus paridis]
MKAITVLPFGVKYTPMEKLALINFEKEPDSIYKGFELQYLNGAEIGQGYRILAYRNDGYVDMYDDLSLLFNPNEECDVAEKGLNKHIQTNIANTVFEKLDGCVQISFDFKDLESRKIHVFIKEQTKKKSIPMNLLAPIGFGSEKPSSLPLFFLYNFDFIRRKSTIVDIRIDNKALKLDPFPFPFPMYGQMRYYTRYTMESQILEFFPIDRQVKEIELDERMRYTDQGINYKFVKTANGVGLSQIELIQEKKVVIHFSPAFVLENQTGEFSICPPEEMGHVDGIYQVEKNGDLANVSLIPNKGWTSNPNTRLTKIILSPKSVFCNWSKEYQYSSVVDLKKMNVRAKWINGNNKTGA